MDAASKGVIMYTVFITHNFKNRYFEGKKVTNFSVETFDTLKDAEQFVLKTNMTSGLTGDTARVMGR